MNIRLMIFSGVITALIGGMIGLGAGKIALQRNVSQIRQYNSQYYINLYEKNFALVGAGTGFLIGIGQAAIRQLKQQQDKEL